MKEAAAEAAREARDKVSGEAASDDAAFGGSRTDETGSTDKTEDQE